MLLTIQQRLQVISPSVRTLSAAEAAKECQQCNPLFIDVREPAEYADSPIPGAVNIPRGLLEMKVLELEKDPARPIYLHCASGARAQLAAEQLVRMGYSQVTAISCGLKDIQQAFD